MVPLAPSMDHAGPMARCVRDLAILLQTVAGPDARDVNCSDRPVPDYLHGLDQAGKPPRLGRLRGLFDDAAPSVKSTMDQVGKTLRASGATITDLALPAAFAEALPRGRTIVAVEAAAFHADRLRRHPDDYPPRIRALVEQGLACPAPEYQRCKALQRQLSDDMKGCFRDIDALLCPATTGPAPEAGSTGDPAFNYPWSLTGLPTVSIPAGKSPDQLPLAIQLVGPAWEEAALLQTAGWCEKTLSVMLGDPPVPPRH
jgi:Asp-tRNA(Asn)/Glu-tRNA(Gln) amidotransferase A subunit family amidase